MVDEAPRPLADSDSPGTSRPSPARDHAIDALRGTAIVLMVLVHVARAVVASDEPGLAGSLKGFLLTVEPYISTLFLTLAGFSLVLARGAAGRPRWLAHTWWRRRVGRAATLVLLSWGIFWVHGGICPPYPFLSADILYTIGLAVLLYAPAVGPSGIRGWVLALLVALGIAGTALAEAHPAHPLARLAQGPGAHLPNLLIPALGIALAWLWHRGRGPASTGQPAEPDRLAAPVVLVPSPLPGSSSSAAASPPGSSTPSLQVGASLLAAGLAIVLGYHLGWAPGNQEAARAKGQEISTLEAVFNRPYGRTAASRNVVTDGDWGSTYDLRWLGHVAGLAQEPPRVVRSRAFWNKKLVLIPYLSGLMLVTFGLAGLTAWSCGRRFRRLRPSSFLTAPLLLLGRHPLKLYVFHLALAAMLSVIPGPDTALPSYLGCVAATLAACLGVAWLVERRGRTRRTSDGRSAPPGRAATDAGRPVAPAGAK